MEEVTVRFFDKVEKTSTCWLWQAGLNADGYGQFSLDGVPRLAHKVAYMWENGEVPEGLQLDHLCRVRRCVRPIHLEAVTQMVNLQRGIGNGFKEKTRCPKNHEYTEINTYTYPNGRRDCRECHRQANRELYDRKRSEGVS